MAAPPVHALRAFTPVPLLFAACTTAGLVLAHRAGLLGLPLALILLSWLAKYAFMLLESEAHGLPPPVLSIESVNPFDERRPLGALLWIAVAIGVTGAAQSALGRTVAVFVGGTFATAAPAALAVLALDGRWLQALNPLAWATVVRGLGPLYAVVAVAALAYVHLVVAAATALPLAGAIGIATVLLLSYATLLGGSVWARRDVLGLDAVADPARIAAREALDEARALDRVADEAYALLRAREPARAWAVLEAWLVARARSPEAYETLLARAARWTDARPAERLQRELVGRLVALGRAGDALLSIESAWRTGRRYSPASARELSRLVTLADAIGRSATAERLLVDCSGEFSENPEIAALRARRGIG